MGRGRGWGRLASSSRAVRGLEIVARYKFDRLLLLGHGVCRIQFLVINLSSAAAQF